MLFIVMTIGGGTIYTLLRLLIEKLWGYKMPIFPEKITYKNKNVDHNCAASFLFMFSILIAGFIYMGVYYAFFVL